MAEVSVLRSAAAFLRTERARELLDVIAVATVCALSLIVLVVGTGIDVWRHDSLYYLPFGPKSTSSGRWLIYLLSGPLTALPGGLLWLLGNLLFSGFAYQVAKIYRQDTRTALLFALLVAQIPCVYGLSLWPVGNLPMPLLLVVAALTSTRMPMVAFYALFGVLFFGVSQQYYFLLPVLHVPGVLASPKGPLRATARLLVLWVSGFVAGYLCALVYVYLASGQLGLPVAEWRDPHPVTDLSSLLENVALSGRWLAEHLGILGQLSMGGLPIIVMAAAGAFGRARQEILVRLVVFGAIGLTIYVLTIPVGVTIHFRTATPLFFAFLALAFLGSPGGLHRRLYPICVLLVFVPFWLTNFENLQWYRAVTDEYRRELVSLSPKPPASYAGLVLVHGTARSLQTRIEESTGRRARYIVPFLSEEKGIETRWRPSGLAAGFRTVRICTSAACRELPDSCLLENDAYCIHGQTPDGRLFMSFVTR